MSRRKSDILLELLYRAGIFRIAQFLNPRSLTVLNYHRIVDLERDGSETFRPNISATPENFARQLDYMRQHFNIISGAELLACLAGKQALPPHAAMITFDDGYRDNWTYAFPLLKERNLPATIFLTTDYLDKCTPFYWDILAYAFRHTQKKQVELPLIGLQSWHDDFTMKKITLDWAEAAKLLPENEKEKALKATIDALEVTIPDDAFDGLSLHWNQVREMAQNGIEMGSHTVSHPILTRISMEQVKEELQESKKRIETETNIPVISFAYPNGGAADFTPAISSLLSELGYHLAFSLMPGPTWYATVKKNPYAIRRIFLRNTDTFARFVAKVIGVTRFLER